MAYIRIKQTHLDEAANNNCTMQVNGVDAEVGTMISNGKIVTLKADDGFIFYTIEEISKPATPATSACFVWFTNGQNVNIPFNVTDDPTIAKWVFPEVPSNSEWFYAPKIPSSGVDIGATGSLYIRTEQATPDVVGSNNIYLIDNEILSRVNFERFNATTQGVADYGQYILSVLQVPTTIDPNYLLEPTNIQLGKHTTSISAVEISTDKLVFNMGSLTVPEVHNNLLDYSGVVCVLHLPYSDSILVEVDYVVGQTLEIEYILDCYTGVVTINLKSSKVDQVFYTKESSLGINIPYMSGQWGSPENTNVKVGGDNRILIPYIEIKSNEAILINGFFTVPIIDESVLLGNSGFLVVDSIELKTSATSSERTTILNIIKDGVIIN